MRPWILYGILLASLACQLVGLVMFAKGFFPYKAISTTFASLEDLPLEPSLTVSEEGSPQTTTVKPLFGKVVLMLVDALRSDFLYGNESDFRLMQSLINSDKAIPFTALASAPTVTLPRLKALTTGTVPGFLDAILNIAESDQSSTLANQDNWIAQLTRSASLRNNAKREPGQEEKRRVGFFGDDTWIKLFPGLFFRSEGTSSFFAMDTVEVDNNVTRHIEPELEKDDWDGLIFHYLGLDHVGHSGGPKSNLMRPKQAEMDSVAHTIYSTLVKKESFTENQRDDLPTLFILCGDHGMNEVGNHGGSSRSEISTSFLFMSPLFEDTKARQQIRSMVDPYRNAVDREDYEYYRSVSQVDLVPTLSLLMGLPIPKNSVGQLIPELFSDLTELELLRAFQINAYQVAGVLRNKWPDFEVESSVLLKDYKDPGVDTDSGLDTDETAHLTCMSMKSEKQRLGCWYTLALAEHASFLEMHPSRTMGNIVYSDQERAQKLQEAKKAYSKFLSDATSMLSTALSKYDMSLLTNGSLFMAFAVAGMIFGTLQTKLFDDFKLSCREPRHVVSLLSTSSPQPPKKRTSMTTLISAAFSTNVTDRTETRSKTTKRDRNEVNWTLARALSAVTLILYLITLFASSFVEEEHQFWYFFNMTWWAVLGLISARYLPPGASSGQLSSFAGAGYCFLQMAILRLLRSWNQTGQKYADQIDLRHYLNSTCFAFSWITFALTIIGLGASVIFVVFSQRPAHSGSQTLSQNATPTGKSALVSVLQSLITVITTLTLLWISVYKIDLESTQFGSDLMTKVYGFMSTISSVGFSVVPGGGGGGGDTSGAQELVYSGYAMARGCYAGMGAIILLTLVLRLVTLPAQPSSSSIEPQTPTVQIEKSLASMILDDRDRTLFVPWMTLAVVTMLMILLSRRHNAMIYAFFGIQLYAYLSWTSMVRQRSDSNDCQEIKEDASELDYVVEETTDKDSETESIDGGHHQPLRRRTAQTTTRAFRTVPGLGSIHSCSVLLWTLSSFFLLGNSNSIASIDISNAYVGIQSYDIFLTGVLTFVSNWAGPLWWTMAALVLMRWDLEWEFAWAKEDRELALKEKEERGWKTVQGWRRGEKGTLNKRTMRRIWKYKKATGVAINKDKEVGSLKEAEGDRQEAADYSEKIKESLGSEVADTPHTDEQVQNGMPQLEDEEEEEDGTFIIEKEQSLEGGQDGAFAESAERKATQGICVLREPVLFKQRLGHTRMVEHLTVTSMFFGMTLYVLSIAAIILRHHLFIWTVFSPKVLYQFAWTVLFQALVQVLIVGGGIWSVIVMSS
ncbi:major facilitator super transporter protein [Linnemannia gamsii]|uniref:GPI ethanolamine phosphate transferase 2 n=1 Tax=Linnemannia gamsii TaxID=64522 RepID=A0ABQ7K164_9FUNG|nr:major facilitator super transporter protein [Linnemannia gamsii]